MSLRYQCPDCDKAVIPVVAPMGLSPQKDPRPYAQVLPLHQAWNGATCAGSYQSIDSEITRCRHCREWIVRDDSPGSAPDNWIHASGQYQKGMHTCAKEPYGFSAQPDDGTPCWRPCREAPSHG